LKDKSGSKSIRTLCNIGYSSFILGTELVTPPLEDLILPGITRDSVITIAQEHISGKKRIAGLPDNLTYSERHITMGEVLEASKEGRLLEIFGSGTSIFD
jgi:branched-chain amino acid aminotransferase